ncbi:hypothetical protein WT24_29235 [Burkholderia sp. MSMB1078WGS]|nr:hypothetical protein WT24_29235 [Burkholderia sp. MSMB1078WGS]
MGNCTAASGVAVPDGQLPPGKTSEPLEHVDSSEIDVLRNTLPCAVDVLVVQSDVPQFDGPGEPLAIDGGLAPNLTEPDTVTFSSGESTVGV